MAKLGQYRSKRDFSTTGEPSGADQIEAVGGTDGRAHASESTFVVQRHRARRLHYDFRLQIEGVLVSWAIPRGPSMDPSAKRLAVHVEDHPLEYGSFEGVIPKGQSGAGDVIVWDRGSFSVHGEGSPAEQLAAGALHLHLDG
ncbi:MAG TPA: DNA polymerase ligase N-terminal domain-containing protein, partial [Microthrixaceae bacterium]|nr:DNA polymerase ligase N-terminal domain-containing protein [Microthrixaceae bacterium]